MTIKTIQNWCEAKSIKFETLTAYQYRLTNITGMIILDLYPVNCKYHVVKHPVKSLHQLRHSYEHSLSQLLDTIFVNAEIIEEQLSRLDDEPEEPEETFEYTSGQKEFMDAVLSGDNVFLTGEAGTGKSIATKEVIKRLKLAGKKVIALAPTGIAANNIDGQTIHSMFNLTPFGVLDFEACSYLKYAKKDLLRNIDTILIDEVSMLRPDILDGIHLTMKKNGLSGLDTKQIIFIGDLMQLPPVLNDNTRSVLFKTYDGEEFTYANIYKKLNVRNIELKEVVRQTNEEFIMHLNVIRNGGKSEYFRKFVNDEPNGIILAPHNVTVQKYNEIGLNQQIGKMFTFYAKIEGTLKPEDFNFEREINVKDGCKIMYLVNSPGEKNPLRNGTLGIFVSRDQCYFIRVGGVDYALDKAIATKKEYVYNKSLDELELQEIGSIEQYPIKLAYALSIHKAQGMTFDNVTVDLSQPCFQRGQMYVALSRVRTPEGLRIKITQ